MGQRPTKRAAEAAIRRFYKAEYGFVPYYVMAHDGDDAWAFWLDGVRDAATSYVRQYPHRDRPTVEWCGGGAPLHYCHWTPEEQLNWLDSFLHKHGLSQKFSEWCYEHNFNQQDDNEEDE